MWVIERYFYRILINYKPRGRPDFRTAGYNNLKLKMYNLNLKLRNLIEKKDDCKTSEEFRLFKLLDDLKSLQSHVLFSTGKFYSNGEEIFEGDKITSFKMPIGIVEWSITDAQWVVRIIESPNGSMTINSIKALKEFFNPTKV